MPQKSSNLSQGFNAQDLFGDLDSLESFPTSSKAPSQQQQVPAQNNNAFFGAPQSNAMKPAAPVSSGAPFNVQAQPFPPAQNTNVFGAPPSKSSPHIDPFNFFAMPSTGTAAPQPPQQQQQQNAAFNPFGDLTSFAPSSNHGNLSSSNYVASSSGNPSQAFNPQLQPRTAPLQPFGNMAAPVPFTNPGQGQQGQGYNAFGQAQVQQQGMGQQNNPAGVANPFAYPITANQNPSQATYNFQNFGPK
jgi:hypothetical protein